MPCLSTMTSRKSAGPSRKDPFSIRFYFICQVTVLFAHVVKHINYIYIIMISMSNAQNHALCIIKDLPSYSEIVTDCFGRTSVVMGVGQCNARMLPWMHKCLWFLHTKQQYLYIWDSGLTSNWWCLQEQPYLLVWKWKFKESNFYINQVKIWCAAI